MSFDEHQCRHYRNEGQVAEFAALREEILERVKAQHQLLSLQLTVTAAIFGFAISRPGMAGILLIVPFVSYLLCARQVTQYFGTLTVGQYIAERLDPRVPGGLGWESWIREKRRGSRLLGATAPLLLTFAGPGLLSSVWTFGWVYLRPGVSLASRVGFITLWLLGASASSLCILLTLQMTDHGRFRNWGA